MNKPFEIRNLLKVDDNYCRQLVEIFDNDYNLDHDKLYGRNDFFKKVNCEFTVDEFKVLNKKKLDQFISISENLLKKLNELYGPGKFWNIHVAKMKENGVILPHVDIALGFVFSHRIHIPLVTNQNVVFKIEDNNYYLSTGNVYEVNNLRLHSVSNNNKSNFERIHLILDYMSDEYIHYIKDKVKPNPLEYECILTAKSDPKKNIKYQYQ